MEKNQEIIWQGEGKGWYMSPTVVWLDNRGELHSRPPTEPELEQFWIEHQEKQGEDTQIEEAHRLRGEPKDGKEEVLD